jgi:hypothetical protein
MRKRRRVGSLWLCVLLCGVLLGTSGCLRFEIRDYDLQALSAPKIPLRVGLYMSPTFRTYQSLSYGPEVLGEGMTKGAEQATRQAFEDVVIIDSLGTNIPRSAIKAVATPEIVEARIINEMGFRLTYEIVCKWTISSVDGRTVYMNTFRGQGVDSSFTARTRISTAMTLAAKDQYDKFVAHVVSTKWWDAIR